MGRRVIRKKARVGWTRVKKGSNKQPRTCIIYVCVTLQVGGCVFAWWDTRTVVEEASERETERDREREQVASTILIIIRPDFLNRGGAGVDRNMVMENVCLLVLNSEGNAKECHPPPLPPGRRFQKDVKGWVGVLSRRLIENVHEYETSSREHNCPAVEIYIFQTRMERGDIFAGHMCVCSCRDARVCLFLWCFALLPIIDFGPRLKTKGKAARLMVDVEEPKKTIKRSE
jgi:hypothetical protein